MLPGHRFSVERLALSNSTGIPRMNVLSSSSFREHNLGIALRRVVPNSGFVLGWRAQKIQISIRKIQKAQWGIKNLDTKGFGTPVEIIISAKY